MPFYEYQCEDCNKTVTLFWPSIRQARAATPHCPHCAGHNLRRLVSRFRHVKGRTATGDGLPFDEGELSALEGEDPRTMARLMRRMSNEVGEPLDPELEEVVDRLEKGDSPETIERDFEAREQKDTSEKTADD